MASVGPYSFTDEDVETTIHAMPALFDQLVGWLPVSAVVVAQPHRDRAMVAFDGLVTGELTDHAAALEVMWTEWRSAMGVLRDVGAYGPSAVGTVTALFRSDGGVPKLPERSLDVGWTGVVGDRQVDRANHGRPFQALCLWSSQVIDGFRAQGHPLAPGLAGENVTLTGLAWERVQPGVRLQLGDVVAEVSAYAVPCRKNAEWFVDHRFDAMHHRNGPVSRMYATVVEPGRMAVGDPVLLEP